MRLTPHRLIGLGFGLAMTLQVITAGLAYENARQQVGDTGEIQATNRLLTQLTTLLSDLRSAESQQRAYFLTADERYHRDYDRSVGHLEETLAVTKALAAPDAGQAARLAAVEPAIRERLLNLRLALETYRREGRAKALPLALDPSAQVQTAQVRGVLHGMALTETARLERRALRAQATARQTMTFVALAGGLALLLVAAASWLMRRDLRHRLAAEANLHVTTHQLQALIEHLHAGILVVDESEAIYLVNQELLQLFDLPDDADAWAGKPLTALAPHLARPMADPDAVLARALRLMQERQVVQGEEVALADGRTFERDYVPIAVDGTSFGHLWVFRDITGRKETEIILTKALKTAQAATQAKSEFLANMSHELRTPLNSVIGFAEMLDDEVAGSLGDEQRDFVQTIQRNGKHLLSLINEILDLSKIEAGHLVLYPEPVDLVDMVGDVVAALRPLATKKRIPIHVEAAVEAAEVQGDPLRLRQVLTNLLTNAIKFSPDEHPIRVAIDRSDGEVRVHVVDRGIGIAPADLQRIFQEFVQLDSSYGRRQEGTGLGLALSRRLVEMQGGRLWVTSQPGEGSTFAIALPALAETTAGTAPDTPQPLPVPERATVLLVEDDPDALALLQAVLGPVDAELVTATDGVAALERARACPPDLIVLDIRLPRQDGWAVLQELRADATLATVPVIVVSGEDNEALGLRLGANDYLVKPLDRARLRHLVRHYLGRPAHVLIVEDNADFSHYLVQVVRLWGRDIRTVGNGAEALQAVAERRPELVLLDLTMPVMDGWRCLERLPDGIPVVVITGQPLTAEQQARLSSQVLAVWEKGNLDPQTLVGNIEALLDAPSSGADARP